MNLLTAVIVEGALEQARKDIEVQDMYEREVKKRMPGAYVGIHPGLITRND